MLSNENNLLVELSAEEQAELNGGRFCRVVWSWRRVCNIFGCFVQWFRIVQCF